MIRAAASTQTFGVIICWTNQGDSLAQSMTRMLIAIVLGSLLGIASRYYSFLNWLSIIPWGIAGFCLGCYCRTKKEATVAGILYGSRLASYF